MSKKEVVPAPLPGDLDLILAKNLYVKLAEDLSLKLLTPERGDPMRVGDWIVKVWLISSVYQADPYMFGEVGRMVDKNDNDTVKFYIGEDSRLLIEPFVTQFGFSMKQEDLLLNPQQELEKI